LLVATALICLPVTLSGCGDSIDNYVAIAKSNLETNLADYSYESLEINYKRKYTYEDYNFYYYDAVVTFADSEEQPNQDMWAVLKLTDGKEYYQNYNKTVTINFNGYVVYGGKTYCLNVSNDYIMSCEDDYSFKYVTTTIPHVEKPYVGMSKKLIDFTDWGSSSALEIKKINSGSKTVYCSYYTFTNVDGGKTYRVVCKKGKVTAMSEYTPSKSTSSGSSSNKSDPYDMSKYADAEDFYYDYKDDFVDFEEAEDYYKKHKKH
jgi:hypothetical protein